MRKALAVALMMALAAGMTFGQEKGSAKKKAKRGAPKEKSEEQKKKELEKQSGHLGRMLKQVNGMIGSLEKSAASVEDPETKKAVEAAMAEGKTVAAGLESASNSAKQGDYEEAMRVGREVSGKARSVLAQREALIVKIDIDRYTQQAAKAGDNAEVAAACQQVVDLSKKKLDLIAKFSELRQQLNDTSREIQKAKRSAHPRKAKARKPRAKKEGRGKKKAKAGAGEAIE